MIFRPMLPSGCDVRMRGMGEGEGALGRTERGGDERGDDGQHVADCLPGVVGDAEVRGCLDILALVAVHEEAVEHVHDVDEGLRAPHCLEEVARALHFGHEFGLESTWLAGFAGRSEAEGVRKSWRRRTRTRLGRDRSGLDRARWARADRPCA